MNKSDLNKLKSKIIEHKNGANEFCVVEGFHALKHAVRFGAQFEFVFIKNISELLELAEQLAPDLLDFLKSSEIIELGDAFGSITSEQIRTGVLALARKNTGDVVESGITVLLDDPRDLNNVGAVIRTVVGLGVDNLMIVGTINAWNFRAMRAAAGLQFALNIVNLPSSSETVSFIKTSERQVVCFDERGEDLTSELIESIDLTGDITLVFGSERSGISPGIISCADKVVRLPMVKDVSSYNLAASVAMGTYAIVNNIND